MSFVHLASYGQAGNLTFASSAMKGTRYVILCSKYSQVVQQTVAAASIAFNPNTSFFRQKSSFTMRGQGSGHRYLVCNPCHNHATYNLFFDLKFHNNQIYYFLATGCVAVTRLEYQISVVQNPWRANHNVIFRSWTLESNKVVSCLVFDSKTSS